MYAPELRRPVSQADLPQAKVSSSHDRNKIHRYVTVVVVIRLVQVCHKSPTAALLQTGALPQIDALITRVESSFGECAALVVPCME